MIWGILLLPNHCPESFTKPSFSDLSSCHTWSCSDSLWNTMWGYSMFVSSTRSQKDAWPSPSMLNLQPIFKLSCLSMLILVVKSKEITEDLSLVGAWSRATKAADQLSWAGISGWGLKKQRGDKCVRPGRTTTKSPLSQHKPPEWKLVETNHEIDLRFETETCGDWEQSTRQVWKQTKSSSYWEQGICCCAPKWNFETIVIADTTKNHLESRTQIHETTEMTKGFLLKKLTKGFLLKKHHVKNHWNLMTPLEPWPHWPNPKPGT